MASLSLSKKERLRGTKNIQTLFRNGKAFFCAPYRVIYQWRDVDEDVAVQVLFAAPKKKFKTAVQRNRLKRQSREAYRIQKPILHALLKSRGKQLQIAFIFSQEGTHSFHDLKQAMQEVFKKISA